MKSSSSSRFFPYFLPTIIFLSVFVGCLALGPFLFNVDGDLGRHLTIGKVILDRGSIPTVDEFSHTRFGDPFSPHEWLAEVIFRLAYNWLGLSGVVLITALLLGLVFWLITYRVFRITQSTPITLILVVLGIAASRIHWLARPHIFTYLFLILWLELLNSPIKFRWKLLWSILIMLQWVNTHGAFIIGIVVLFIFLGSLLLKGIFTKNWAETVLGIKQYCLLIVSSLLVSLLNPDGIRIWQTIIGFLSSRYLVSHTAEYMPPVLYQTGVLPFSTLLVIGVICLILCWKRLSIASILLLISFGVFGITSGRNIPLYIIIALPILAECLSRLFPKFKLHLDRINEDLPGQSTSKPFQFGYPVVLSILILVFGVVLIRVQPALSERNQYTPSKYPVQAVEWLKTHPQQGKMFNDFMWGGYLLYRLWPEALVFIDGQTDFYGEALTRDYETISNGWEGWDRLLDQYQVSWIIIPIRSPLVEKLIGSGDWISVYSDPTTAIYSFTR